MSLLTEQRSELEHLRERGVQLETATATSAAAAAATAGTYCAILVHSTFGAWLGGTYLPTCMCSLRV